MVGNLEPLDQWKKIVKDDGTPTTDFIRWAQQRQIDISNGIDAAQAQQLIDDWAAARQIIAGNGLDGGGNLSADVTLTADVQEILDQLTTTHGSILYRDSAAWAALVPGTSGQVLQTNGSGADPSWVTPSSGSGGGFFSGASNTLPGIAATGAFATKGVIFKPYQDMTVERLMTWVDPNGTTDQYRIQIADLSSVTIDATDPRKITAATVGTVLGSTTATAIGSTNMRMVKQALSSSVVCSSGTYYALAAVYQQASGTAVARIMGPAAGNQSTFDLNAPCDTYESAFVTTTVGISNGQVLTLQTGWYCCAVEGTL